MDKLSETQKEILIFLLLVVIMILVTVLISWRVWLCVCKKEIERERQIAIESQRHHRRMSFDTPEHISHTQASAPLAPWQSDQHFHTFTFDQPQPSSNHTSSTNVSAPSNGLPSYETVMRTSNHGVFHPQDGTSNN